MLIRKFASAFVIVFAAGCDAPTAPTPGSPFFRSFAFAGRALSCCLCTAIAGLAIACGGTTLSDLPTGPSVPAQQPTPAVQVPPDPYLVSGQVREVNGGAIAGVRVYIHPTPETLSDDAGAFSIAATPQRALIFTKEGFRNNHWTVPVRNSGLPVLMKMQRQYSLSADAGVSSVITDDDLSYTTVEENSFFEGSYACAPCKEIRVRNSAAGGRLHLRWTGSIPLELWAGDLYSGPSAHGAGVAGASELVLDVPGTLNNILVGVGLQTAPYQRLLEPIAFELTIEG